MFKFIGFYGWYFRVFNELVEVIIESLDIIFESSWRIDEVFEDWKRVDLEFFFKKGNG